tara:strand:+ start:358 stop:480 length:123 start_codon:yes stop_codon:yes gene_type:complete
MKGCASSLDAKKIPFSVLFVKENSAFEVLAGETRLAMTKF